MEKSYCQLPIAPSLTKSLIKKISAKESPTTMKMNMIRPGAESRYCDNAALRVRPLKLGVHVN